MIDNLHENFKLQPNNGLEIKTWNDDMKDKQLLHFLKLLVDIAKLNPPDVRPIIKKIKAEVTKRGRTCQNPFENISIV